MQQTDTESIQGSPDTSDSRMESRWQKLHQEVPKRVTRASNKDAEFILRRVATWANSGRKLVSSPMQENTVELTCQQQEDSCKTSQTPCSWAAPASAPRDCRPNFTGMTHQKNMGKFGQATATSNCSRVRTKNEKGDPEKLIAWRAAKRGSKTKNPKIQNS